MEDLKDWIVWLPSGYYMSSPSGDNFFGWSLNRPMARGRPVPFAQFYRASQFERLLYRPDVVLEYVKRLGRVDVAGLAGAAGFQVTQLDTIAPPDIQIAELHSTDPGMAKVKVSIGSSNLPIADWNLFVNEIPVLSHEQRAAFLKSPAANALAAELSLNRTASLDVVRVEASNSKAIGIAELPLTAAGKLEPESSKRSLFVAAIGASQFKDTRIPTLKFAAKDAEAIGELLRANKGSAYQEVHTLILSDEGRDGRPLRATIAERLPPFLRQARAQDTVIVFLASHGLSNARGDYFFVPLDASREDLDQAKLGAGDAGSLLPWQFFAQLLADSAGRRVLIVDTCAAAAIEGSSFDAYSLAKRSTASKFALLAASTGKELSQESAVHLHGLFTFGLLDAIETAADTNEAGVVTLKDAFQHARDLVEAQHNRAVGTQTPQAVIPEVLESIPLGRRTGLVN
jgi:Caspase domain